MGEKSAENIVNGIAASKEVPFERVLFALGIRFVGETVAKKIAKSFTDIEELENADLEKLKNIDEIGEKIAQSIITYFSNPANRELVERLKSNGLQLHRTEEDSADTPTNWRASPLSSAAYSPTTHGTNTKR